jgi:hypothetical protein
MIIVDMIPGKWPTMCVERGWPVENQEVCSVNEDILSFPFVRKRDPCAISFSEMRF